MLTGFFQSLPLTHADVLIQSVLSTLFSFLPFSRSLPLSSSASLLHMMHVSRQGESSRHVKESWAELGFRTPAEARMQNGDEQALPWMPNWGPFKIPTEDQSWFSSGATRGWEGPARASQIEKRDKEMWSSPDTSGINLHMERFLCKNTPIVSS